MNRREKIIVGLVIAAAIGGSIDYLLSSTSQKSVSTAPTVDISAAVNTATAELAALQLSPARRQILENIKSPWRPNLLSQFEPSDAEAADRFSPRPVYSAYLRVNGKEFGILNGRDYMEGDWLDDGTYQIKKIGPTEATLIPSNGGDPMQIPIDFETTRGLTQ